MSFGKRFGIVAAMEELEEDQQPEELEVGDNAESAETDMIEVAEVSADIEAGNEEIDQAAENAESLDAIADTMEASEENGGLDETAAAIAEVAVEGLYARLGVSRKKAMPAMESFGSQSSRVKATKIAVEGIREVVKNAWASIVKFFEQVQAWVVQFFKKIFDTKTKLKARAEKLAEVAKKLEGTPKAEKFEAPALGKALVTGTEVSAENVAKALISFGEVVNTDSFLAAYAKTAVEQQTKLVDALNDEEKFNAVLKENLAFNTSNLKAKASTGKWYNRKPAEGFAEYVLVDGGAREIGNTVIVAVVPEKPLEGIEGVKASKNIRVRMEVNADAKTPTEVKTATPAEIGQMCNGVLSAIEGLDAMDKNFKASEQASKNLVAAVKKAASNTKDNKDAAARAKVLQASVVAAVRLTSAFPTMAGKLAVTTAKAALDYSEKSIKQYGDAKPEAKPAE